MWYQQYSPKIRWALAVLTCLAGGASADILTVGPAPDNTYLTLTDALAAAEAGDVIILDEMGSPYALTAEVVIDDDLSPLRIQGQFNNDETPDEIVIQGAAGAPVFTVETGAQATFRHLTVTGGTIGIQAMDDSELTLERVYISETGAEGVSVTGAEEVNITSSIFNACGSAGLQVNNGTVDVTQCTFIDNTGLGIDLQDGDCEVSFSLFYNNNGGRTADQLDGAVAGLDIDYCYVDGGTPAMVNVAATPTIDPTVTTAFAGDPETDVFDATSTWRGQLILPIRSGNPASPRVSDAPFGRDFVYLSRDAADAQIGAHEFGAVAGAETWVDCVISQNGTPLRSLVTGGEEFATAGFITIEIFMSGGSLQDAILFLEPENGDVSLRTGRVVIELADPVPGSENYSTAEYFIDPDHFVPSQDGAALLLDGLAELYLQIPEPPFPPLPPENAEFPGTNTYDYGGIYGLVEPAAEAGRTFVIDTLPPQIDFFSDKRAHEYVSGYNDANSPPTASFSNWSAFGDAPLASSDGVLNGALGGRDPHVFFNMDTPDLDFTITIDFIDSNGIPDNNGVIIPISQTAGFGPAPAPEPTYTGLAAITERLRHPTARGMNPRGTGWWEMVQSIRADDNTELNISYAGGSGATLTVTFAFNDVLTDTPANSFWESIAQFGAQDLAGNVAGANPGNSPLIQTIKPFHIWQMAFAAGAITSGPGGRDTTAPVFNWGVQRFGVTPVNTDNAFLIAQYAVFGRAAGEDPNSLGWIALNGDGSPAPGVVWSDWTNERRIDQYTEFQSATGTYLGNMIQALGQYMIVIRTADEAGNEVDDGPIYPGGPIYTYPAGAETLAAFNGSPFVADTWTNGGAGAGAGLDTRVSPTFWHNFTDSGNLRIPDAGERRLASATRVPLPPAGSCQRVEAGFIVEMELADSMSPGSAGVYFEFYEDGALAARGFKLGTSGSTNVRLIFPEDLLNDPGNLNLDFVSGFLNYAVDFTGAALDCDGDAAQDQDRLGDEGYHEAESPYRKRDVRYRLVVATALDDGSGAPDFGAIDQTPATVEFTVTVDRGLREDQPIKSFKQD